MSQEDLHAEFAHAKANLQLAQERTTQAAEEEQHWQDRVRRTHDLITSKCFIHKRLPNEILFKVFLHLVEGFDAKYPWSLLAVCKLWNKVCLENPSLWSRFDLSSGHPCGVDTQHGARASAILLTMKQLERSRSAQIYIRVGTLCDCTSQVSKFRVVVEHSSRWKTVEFDGIKSRNALGAEFLRNLIPPQCKFTNLRSLEWAALPTDDKMLKLPFTGYAHLPSLTTAIFRNVGDVSADKQFPWNQLTTLTLKLYCGPVHGLLSILPLCQNLNTLVLTTNQRLPETPNTPSPDMGTDIVTLPRVTHAEIVDNRNCGVVPSLVPLIRLPALTHLSMGPTLLLDIALSLIQRSSCGGTLTELKLFVSIPNGKQLDFLPLVQACPNLGVFTINDIQRDVSEPHLIASYNELLRLLVLHEGDPEMRLPRLEKFCLLRPKFDPVLLLQMVDSRLKAVQSGTVSSQCLKELEIMHVPAVSAAPPHSDSDYLFLRSLLEQKYRGHGKANLKIRIWRVLVGFTFV